MSETKNEIPVPIDQKHGKLLAVTNANCGDARNQNLRINHFSGTVGFDMLFTLSSAAGMQTGINSEIRLNGKVFVEWMVN
ncbi:MAG: hypothetical protein FWE54_03020 [Methanimicrococcus sp.]|nr:hypothetical protein [Methanimicrococcus sp.]